MTPLLLGIGGLIVLLLMATVVVLRRTRRHLPSGSAVTEHYDNLREQLRLAHAQSIERTAALNRDLEMLRTGREWRGTRHDR